jgi:hypothetical protein
MPGHCRRRASVQGRYRSSRGRTRRAALVVSVAVRERRKQRCICATGSAASAVVRCSSKCNIRARDQRAISDPTGELRDRTFDDQPLCAKSIGPSARLTPSVGYIRLYGHLPEQLHGKPTDPRALSNEVPPSTLELLYELRINSMSFENLYLDEMEPWIEREDHCQVRA